jgi:hypothetical protein
MHGSCDFVRLLLLYLYGGVWMDAGTLLFWHIDDICCKILSDPQSPYEVAARSSWTNREFNIIMNGFIKRWHNICMEM